MYDDLVRDLRDDADWAEKYAVPTILLYEMRRAADAIEELSKQVEQLPRWIPVTEQPPLEVGDDGYNGYLVFANGYYEVADYASDEFDNVPYFHVDGEWEPTVTHFMPLPEPPKEEI